MDYGASVDTKDKLDAPRRQKNPTTAKFELPDIAAVLSIQGRLQRGINSEEDFKSLLKHLKKQAAQEVTSKRPLDRTPTAQLFLAWQGDAVPKLTLEAIELDYSLKGHVPALSASIGKNPDVIKLFLERFVLTQVQIFPYKQTSTAQDLMAGFLNAVMFSATLGNVELYHTLGGIEKRFWEDTAFQAEVMQRASLLHNSTMHWLPQGTPYQLFEDLYNKDPSLFQRLDGSLDMGGWNKDITSLDYARQFMQFAEAKGLPFDGITFFQREDKDGKIGEKALYFLAKGAKDPVKLSGTKISPELGRVFKLYAPEDTTGTDLVLARDAKMLITLGESATLSLVIQTIMRMRQFLGNPIDPEKCQSLIWVGPEKLQNIVRSVIQKDSDLPLTPADAFGWMLVQEANRREKAIVQRAYQEIQFVVRNHIMEEVRKYKDNPEKQIEIYQKHEEAFRLDLDRDTFALYGMGTGKTDTQVVLVQYAKSFAGKAHVALDETMKTKINTIATRTARLVDQIPQKVAQDLSAQAQMEQVARQEQKQQQQQQQQSLSMPAMEHLEAVKPLDYAGSSMALDKSGFSQPSEFHKKAQDLFKIKAFSPDLTIANNVVATNVVKKDVPSYLKPIEYILIVEDKDSKGISLRRAIAVSQDDAKTYQSQLKEGKAPDNMTRKAALFTRDGHIAFSGKGKLAFDAGALEKLEKDPWFRNIKSDVNILSGQLTDEEDEKRAQALIKEVGKDFGTFWKDLVSHSLDPHSLDTVQMQELLLNAA